MTDEKGFIAAGAGFRYGSVAALGNLDIVLPPGKFYGVVGPNGCGKTTFLDLLVGNKTPSVGSVTFQGRPVTDYRRRDLARRIALVPQDYAINLAFTVEEVVLMGRHPHIRRFGGPSDEDWRLVDDAMETIGIGPFRFRHVNELSGGEKQRVAVARALAQDTPVLLFDEATASLDVQYTLQIFNVARKLVKEQNRTVIAVMHNLNLATAYCDELIFMKGGRIVADGLAGGDVTPTIIREVFGVESSIRFDDFSNAHQVSFRYWS